MGCSCKHCASEIDNSKQTLSEFRNLFIKRMTVDSKSQDRRKKDYNQAIFSWWNDEKNKTPENTFPCFEPMSMDIVLQCFDNAVKDFRRTFCDVDTCRRK